MDPKDLFSRFEAQYGLPSGHLDAMYAVESNRGRNTYNAQSGAAGPFQFMPKTAARFGVRDPYDLRQSAEGAAKLAADAAKLLAKRNLPVTPENLYLVHQQGSGAAPALLNSPTKAALDVLTSVYGNPRTASRAITLNGGRLDMSAGDFANHVASTYLSKSGRQPSKVQTAPPPSHKMNRSGPAPNSFAAALRNAASSAIPQSTRSFIDALIGEDPQVTASPPPSGGPPVMPDVAAPQSAGPASDAMAKILAKLGRGRASSFLGQ